MSQVNVNGVRTLLVVIAALLGGVPSIRAQQPGPSTASLERIRAALQDAQQPINGATVPPFAPSRPDEFRLGIVTFVPPDAPGQFVSIRVPLGAFISRAAHAIGAGQHRRAENAARVEVAKALAVFQQARSK